MSSVETMKGLVCSALGKVELVELPRPEISHGSDAIIRVTATSLCGSDLHMLSHPEMIGQPIGHEFVGTVDAIGSAVIGLQVGDRVVGPAAVWCGTCVECKRGQESFCVNGGIFGCGPEFGSLGGAQSEYIRVPWASRTLAQIPDSVTDKQALAVGDALSTAWAGVRRVIDKPGALLLVLGCGPIGLSAVITSRLHGVSHVIAVDPDRSRRRFALELGAQAVFASVTEALPTILEVTGGRGADGVVDAAGVPATIQGALDAIGVGGKIAILGLASTPVEVDFLKALYKSTTVWAGLGDLTRMDALLAAINAGQLNPEALFTEHVELNELPAIYSQILDNGTSTIKYFVTLT